MLSVPFNALLYNSCIGPAVFAINIAQLLNFHLIIRVSYTNTAYPLELPRISWRAYLSSDYYPQVLPTLMSAQIRGSASFTGNDHTKGTCSLANYTLPAGISNTGMGPSDWATRGKCGSCLQVHGPHGSTKVMVDTVLYYPLSVGK